MNKNSGFTLIEILIATLILAVGLLGLAGLQVTSIRNNTSAYNRSQATQLFYDMADRMRANKTESIDPATGNVIAAGAYLTIAPVDATAQVSCATTAGCTRAQIAENDLFQWHAALIEALPGAIGTITAATATRVFTITINWDDNHDGAVDASDPNFSVSFQL